MSGQESRECPLCGGSMQLKRLQQLLQVPGNPKATATTAVEWVCPDCDYFEEVDEKKT